jgi:hypothetical protein
LQHAGLFLRGPPGGSRQQYHERRKNRPAHLLLRSLR